MKDDIQPTRQAKTAVLALKKNILDKVSPPSAGLPVESTTVDQPERIRLHHRVHWWVKSLTKKELLLVLGAFFIFAGGIGYAIVRLSHADIKEAASLSVKQEAPVPPKPTTVASRMTGVQVASELNDLPVTGVMIENSPDARPQSGLLQADMVFEAIAEGGITRFLALYQESQPDYIGPVRSARPYYLDFVVAYDAALGHAGGSADALAQIRNEGIKDLDHGANGSTYQRVNNRYAPHNLYTSRAKLLEAQSKRGYTTSSYKGLARKEKDEPVTVPTARTIDFTVSSFLYNPHFDYDAVTNTYKRSEGGKPHVDERSGTQIASKVVVALVMPHHYEGIYSVYLTRGSGAAMVFQNGTVTPVTWEKANRKSELILKDTSGAPLALNPGQTWLTLVSTASAIKYAP